MAPFDGWGSIASRLKPLRGGSLLFTTKFSEIPGAHFIDLGRMKDRVDFGATQWFWTREPWTGDPAGVLSTRPLLHYPENVIHQKDSENEWLLLSVTFKANRNIFLFKANRKSIARKFK